MLNNSYTKQELIQAITLDTDIVYRIPKVYLKDKDIALCAIQNFFPYQTQEYVKSEIFHVFPPSIQYDPDIIAAAWEAEGISALYYIRDHPSIFSDKDFWLKTLARPYRNVTDPSYLYYYLKEPLKSDVEILAILCSISSSKFYYSLPQEIRENEQLLNLIVERKK